MIRLEEQWHHLLRAWMELDGRALDALLSTRPETTWIGPSPKALWQGRTAILAGLSSSPWGRELAALETQALDAHDEGAWGWVMYRGVTGSALLQVTSVWVREADTWRLLLLHAAWSEVKPADLLTGTRQTMLTWARLIETPAQLPLAYRGMVARRFGAEAPFPYMVLVPAFTDPALALPEQVMFEQDGVLVILARRGEEVTECAYPLGDLWSVETGSVLLQSWLTLDGRTRDGTWATTTLAFSTASHALLKPFVQRIRAFGPKASLKASPVPATEFDAKFIHEVEEALLPDETIIARLWRPNIALPAPLASAWPFYNAERVNHLALLTDRELILMWDKVPEAAGEDEGYGMVRRYIPLKHITEASIREDAFGAPSLALTLGGTVKLERLFTVNQRIELEELVHKINAAVQALA